MGLDPELPGLNCLGAAAQAGTAQPPMAMRQRPAGSRDEASAEAAVLHLYQPSVEIYESERG